MRMEGDTIIRRYGFVLAISADWCMMEYRNKPERRSGRSAMQETTCEAVVEETVFRNEENGYSVISVRAGKETCTAVGILPPLTPGEQLLLTGTWVDHPHYGRQFKCTGCQIRKPTSLLGIERFLSSGLIKGVGEATARLLVNAFGEDTLDAMTDVDRLKQLKGISEKRARMIAASFAEQYGVRRNMIFLQSYGISPALAMKIAKAYGERTEEVMRSNPYRMVDDVEGAGFLTADRIALSMGIARDSGFRLRSGMKYLLQEASVSAGHTYLPRETLLRRAAEMLNSTPEALENHLNALLLDRELVLSRIGEEDCVFLSSMYYCETETAMRLLKILETAPEKDDRGVLRAIGEYERGHGMTFSPLQKQAVLSAVEKGVLVITGGPGTGKTTIINCILSLLSPEGKVLLAAPTGRAAKRMSEATGEDAKTIHRLLEYSGEEQRFLRNQDNPLKCACVIVDEMSMVDIFLMRSLLRALRGGTRLILVGDADQLPSVGAGNVLRDILASGAVPSVRLTDIYRQSAESMIVMNAHRINQGEMPVLNRKGSDFFFDRRLNQDEAARTIVSLCSARLPAYLNLKDGFHSIQVMAPAKKGPCGVIALNRLLQDTFNPERPRRPQIVFGDQVFRPGDKVMHIKNDYQLAWTTDSGEEGEGVFNGDVGFVTDVDAEDHSLTVRYDDERNVTYEYGQLEELELAYCISVHKSQGSEFPAVVMPVTGGPKMLLTRNLFYTALTRARELVVLVGSERVIEEMVGNNYITVRYTALCQRILEQSEAPAAPVFPETFGEPFGEDP